MALYLANDKYNASLSSGYTAGQNTLSVSNVPDNVPTIVVAAKGTTNETIFTVTGKTTNSLTGVARLRGANVDLDAQTPITCLNVSEFVNQYSTAVSTPETLTPLYYAEDGGSTDAYAISLDPAISDYVTGLMVVFKANTVNTGAATLNVNGKGAITIKKKGNIDLEDGDIKSGQVITVIYDGTNFQLQSVGNTLTNPVVSGIYDNGDSGTSKQIDWANGDMQKVTLTGNCTFSYANAKAGQRLTLLLIEDGTGGRTITLPTSKYPNGAAPSYTTTLNAINAIVVIYDGTNYLTQGAVGFA